MANKEQIARLKGGTEKWNRWRRGEGVGVEIDLRKAYLGNIELSRANLRQANLSHSELRGANLIEADLLGADLVEADLREADLIRANLRGANLRGAVLRSANLIEADLSEGILRRANLISSNLYGANLKGADLRGASLIEADLRGLNLEGANLTRADLESSYLIEASFKGAILSRANLRGAKLRGAEFVGARFISSSLGNLDLSGALGLAAAEHIAPSEISTRTLEDTAWGLSSLPLERRSEIEVFFRGAGVSEELIHAFQSMIGQPIQFYSAFISYSHSDKPFARRLYSDLQMRGIRCWLDEKDGRIGDPIYEAVNQAIRSTDRVILCCSLASLTSKWVDRELTMTFDQEDKLGQSILLPLDLDGALFDWTSAKAVMVRERIAARFEGWDKDPRLYEERLERIVEAMRLQREPVPGSATDGLLEHK